MDISNENIIYKCSNNRRKIIISIMYLAFINIVCLFSIVLYFISDLPLLTLILVFCFTIFLDIISITSYFDYKGKSIILTEDNLYILKNEQVKKVIPCGDIKILSDGILNTVIYDGEKHKEHCYFLDIEKFEQELLDKGYDIYLPPSKTENYLILLIILGFIGFQLYKGYNYKQQNIPFVYKVKGFIIYRYQPPNHSEFLPGIRNFLK